MREKEERFELLFDLYVSRNASASQESELMQLLLDPELSHKKEILVGQAYDLEPGYLMTDLQATSIFSNIVKSAHAEKQLAPVWKLALKRWLAAASVILAIGVGTYLFQHYPPHQNKVLGIVEAPLQDIKAPSTNRAMITLSNGQTIYLDSAANGKIMQQGGLEIVKLADGKIAYSGNSKDVIYNTLTNPRGSKIIDMVLADGSHVWLNAGSSVTFPLSFVGKDRRVKITGEAYFEVAKNAAIPFRVNVAGKCEIEVLGTRFNVNSYDDEAVIKTTLLEGSVSVKAINTHESLLIAPGQQAQLNSNAQISLNSRPNLEQIMAWKNGYLHFDNADLQLVMRQLARWYDVEIFYQGELPKRQFAGDMQLDLNLSQVLRILETNNVHFRIDGKKLYVSN